MHTASSRYLDQCRAAMQAEQASSLAQTQHWAHVDRAQVHADWDALYKRLALLVDQCNADSAEVQQLVGEHHAIACRFYLPSREAYIGMSLFYQDNADMRSFHNAYHPRMVEFLADAIFVFAQQRL
ncbi:TipAS antibiotic-recognition domain-containing protein [Paucibacter sp. APW11]|uniref:TipAS antibiotic-recognition domain-containing protein n=1 Tax=Roseateles aquae TaxID=3077235 RepID=A0ABU3PIN4_9BURK|nr:TipAS antibiotic-recognition domain-containing protein [Paucibacter sp. APW11]MDT9002426.1 TipAS antibiotic-recognition domain-containing protein [Paucibacter sp. APW11]